MAVFEGAKSSNDIVNNGTMSDDEEIASDVTPRYLFFSFCVFTVSFFPFISWFLDCSMKKKNKSGGR